MSIYRLTKEGKDYLENGLPEKNLVDLLKKRFDISIGSR